MKKFGNPMGTVPKAQHKSIGQAQLPNRAAVHRLTRGGGNAASINDFAAALPGGSNGPQTYPQIIAEGEKGASVEP